jgi:hypothetical protein
MGAAASTGTPFHGNQTVHPVFIIPVDGSHGNVRKSNMTVFLLF